MKRGFTLIELLIVVLIIGILAAVAVPQYQKAVEKARLAEVLQNLASMQKAVDVFVLSNPNYDGGVVGCAEKSDGRCGVLDIDIESMLTCDMDGRCRNKNFAYGGHGNGDGSFLLEVFRVKNGDFANENMEYNIEWARNSAGTWTKTCMYEDSIPYTHMICQSLANQWYSISSF